MVARFPAPGQIQRTVKRRRAAGGHGTYARLTAFTRGVIWGMYLAGMQRKEMLPYLRKKDGTELSLDTLDHVISMRKADPDWDSGSVHVAGGRPCELSPIEKKVVDLVFAERGQAKVTLQYCKKRLRFLRRVNRQTVAAALHEAGLKWLTRRLKWKIP